MSYSPASWRFGWIVSLVALGVLVALGASGLAASRRAASA
jgi:hypothetical protein